MKNGEIDLFFTSFSRYRIQYWLCHSCHWITWNNFVFRKIFLYASQNTSHNLVNWFTLFIVCRMVPIHSLWIADHIKKNPHCLFGQFNVVAVYSSRKVKLSNFSCEMKKSNIMKRRMREREPQKKRNKKKEG